MTKISQDKISQFTLRGKLSKIKLKGGKVKYLKLTDGDRLDWIKVSKAARKNLDRDLVVGCHLEITGREKQHFQTGKSKFKAEIIKIIAHPSEIKLTHLKQKPVSLAPIFERTKQSTAKVLVCQKSNCWKRGGKEICQQLETEFGDRGLDNLVQIKKTGCLKKCSKAPNVVMMPDKTAYSNVKPKQIPNLVEKHLLV
ncbi:MAG: (2Fe-2S) ferredoxin domain-containing protein [Pleurocapsa sp.]